MSGPSVDAHEGNLEAGREAPRLGRLSPALIAVILGALLGALYWRVAWGMGLQWWDDPNYSHGFLVPPFCLYLVWRRRLALRLLPRGGSLLGIPLILAGAGALLLGDAAADNFLMRSSLLVILAGLILFHLGREIFRALLIPFLFLFFMVPLPAVIFYAITFPLQRLAAEQAAWTLDFLGVPVLLDGNIIHLAQLSLGVTEACSGIRSLISLSAGALAWGYLFLPTGWAVLVLALATVPITIVANAARVVLTGLIGRQFGVEYATGFFHEFAGLAIYAFAFLCLVGTHGVIRLVLRLLERRRA